MILGRWLVLDAPVVSSDAMGYAHAFPAVFVISILSQALEMVALEK